MLLLLLSAIIGNRRKPVTITHRKTRRSLAHQQSAEVPRRSERPKREKKEGSNIGSRKDTKARSATSKGKGSPQSNKSPSRSPTSTSINRTSSWDITSNDDPQSDSIDVVSRYDLRMRTVPARKTKQKVSKVYKRQSRRRLSDVSSTKAPGKAGPLSTKVPSSASKGSIGKASDKTTKSPSSLSKGYVDTDIDALKSTKSPGSLYKGKFGKAGHKSTKALTSLSKGKSGKVEPKSNKSPSVAPSRFYSESNSSIPISDSSQAPNSNPSQIQFKDLWNFGSNDDPEEDSSPNVDLRKLRSSKPPSPEQSTTSDNEDSISLSPKTRGKIKMKSTKRSRLLLTLRKFPKSNRVRFLKSDDSASSDESSNSSKVPKSSKARLLKSEGSNSKKIPKSSRAHLLKSADGNFTIVPKSNKVRLLRFDNNTSLYSGNNSRKAPKSSLLKFDAVPSMCEDDPPPWFDSNG